MLLQEGSTRGCWPGNGRHRLVLATRHGDCRRRRVEDPVRGPQPLVTCRRGQAVDEGPPTSQVSHGTTRGDEVVEPRQRLLSIAVRHLGGEPPYVLAYPGDDPPRVRDEAILPDCATTAGREARPVTAIPGNAVHCCSPGQCVNLQTSSYNTPGSTYSCSAVGRDSHRMDAVGQLRSAGTATYSRHRVPWANTPGGH